MLGGVTPEQETALRDWLQPGYRVSASTTCWFTPRMRLLGKPVGDLREGKVTLPIILLLRRGGAEATASFVTSSAIGLSPGTVARHHPAAARASLHRACLRDGTRLRLRAKTCSAFPPSQERDAPSRCRTRCVQDRRAFRLTAEAMGSSPVACSNSVPPQAEGQLPLPPMTPPNASSSSAANPPTRGPLLRPQRPGDCRRRVRCW